MLALLYVILIWYDPRCLSSNLCVLTVMTRCFSGVIQRRSPRWRRLRLDMRTPALLLLWEATCKGSKSGTQSDVLDAVTRAVSHGLCIAGRRVPSSERETDELTNSFRWVRRMPRSQSPLCKREWPPPWIYCPWSLCRVFTIRSSECHGASRWHGSCFYGSLILCWNNRLVDKKSFLLGPIPSTNRKLVW